MTRAEVKKISWGLLLWRFLSYYIILIHGFIHELYKIFKNIAKNKKLKKQGITESVNLKSDKEIIKT